MKKARSGSIEAPKGRPAEGSLYNFLSEKAAEVPKPEHSPDQVMAEWRQALQSLVTTIRGWIKPLEDAQLAHVHEDSAVVTEQWLGTFQVPLLTIYFPSVGAISVKPIARLIIGAEGRVDLVNGPRYVAVIRKKGTGWNIAEQSPKLSLTPLTKETFEGAVRELLSPAWQADR